LLCAGVHLGAKGSVYPLALRGGIRIPIPGKRGEVRGSLISISFSNLSHLWISRDQAFAPCHSGVDAPYHSASGEDPSTAPSCSELILFARISFFLIWSQDDGCCTSCHHKAFVFLFCYDILYGACDLPPFLRGPTAFVPHHKELRGLRTLDLSALPRPAAPRPQRHTYLLCLEARHIFHGPWSVVYKLNMLCGPSSISHGP